MTPIHAIRDRLLQGLDQDYNVVDMAIVVDVISQLENYVITKEALEATRLGKHINELRRKAHDKQLASRAKSLVKKWRELLMPTPNSGSATPVQPSTKDPKTVAASAAQRLQNHQLTNGHSQPSSRLTSPAVSSSSRLSPGLVSANNVHRGSAPPTTVNNHNSSSLPSSASSSPGLSRPTTPSLGSRPVSPAVPKTHVANKRLRKDLEPEFEAANPAKKARLLNGESSQCDSERVLVNGQTKVNNQPSTRKKKQELEREKLLEEKIINAKRQKVKTTQELMQELALRSSTSQRPKASQNSGMPQQTSNIAGSTAVVEGGETSQIVSEMPKTELMNRFFESQTAAAANGHSNVLSPPLSDGAPSPEVVNSNSNGFNGQNSNSNRGETVEDVLALLPPIDVATILAEINSEMQDEDDLEEIEGLIPVKKPEPISESLNQELVQELHNGKHEGVNGNFTHDGAFKEWHEVVSKETKDGDLLYILPYSVID